MSGQQTTGAYQQLYGCRNCGHRIKLYEREEQAVFCRCIPSGPPMIPVDRDAGGSA